jgi:hypothetical protein
MSEKKGNNRAAEGGQGGQTEKAVRGKSGGAVSVLPVFDHGEKCMDALEYEAAVRAIFDHVSTYNGEASYVIRFSKHFDWETAKPKFTLPAGINTEADANLKKKLEDRYEKEYGVEISDWIKARNRYKEECKQLYGLVWGQCTLALRHRIAEEKDHETMKEASDLLKLWKLVSVLAKSCRNRLGSEAAAGRVLLPPRSHVLEGKHPRILREVQGCCRDLQEARNGLLEPSWRRHSCS